MKYRGLLLPMILAAMCGDDAFVLNTKRGKGMQSTYRREKIVRTEKEFDINGTKVMAYSRKERRPVKVCALCIYIMLDILPSLKQTGFLDTNVRNPRFYNRWNHPHFPTRKCPSEVARQGKYNV